jgi:hypothetical protein
VRRLIISVNARKKGFFTVFGGISSDLWGVVVTTNGRSLRMVSACAFVTKAGIIKIAGH